MSCCGGTVKGLGSGLSRIAQPLSFSYTEQLDRTAKLVVGDTVIWAKTLTVSLIKTVGQDKYVLTVNSRSFDLTKSELSRVSIPGRFQPLVDKMP